jgi:hypothetical protein
VSDKPATTAVTLSDCEFQRSCDNCGSPSIAFVILAHTSNGGCPNRGKFYCQAHYDEKYSNTVDLTLHAGSFCNICFQVISPVFDDNFRAVLL